MQYTTTYDSPIGAILLACDHIGLTGLWFEGQKFYALNLDTEHCERNTPIFDITKRWLDIYFEGKEPDFMPAIHMIGSDFQLSVWKILLRIPYGNIITYGGIAKQIAKERNLTHMSAQAVGNAVGHNKLSIIIPCHRVVGSDGNLTGYAGGLDKKVALLKLEGADMSNLFVL